MSDNKKPAATINVFPVSIAIWKHETEKGIFYSTTLQRRYRDAGGAWKSSDSLNESDLLLAAKALDLAHTEILKLRANDRNAQPDDQAA
jgi:hypothetical protein